MPCIENHNKISYFVCSNIRDLATCLHMTTHGCNRSTTDLEDVVTSIKAVQSLVGDSCGETLQTALQCGTNMSLVSDPDMVTESDIDACSTPTCSVNLETCITSMVPAELCP